MFNQQFYYGKHLNDHGSLCEKKLLNISLAKQQIWPILQRGQMEYISEQTKIKLFFRDEGKNLPVIIILISGR